MDSTIIYNDAEAGASAVEYALVLAAVAAVVVAIIYAFGSLVFNLHHDNCTTINNGVQAGIGVSTDCG